MAAKLGTADVSFRLGAVTPSAVYLGAVEVWTDFVPTVPGIPTGLTAAASEETQASVDVSWTAPASDGGSPITGYNVYLSFDGNSYTLHAAVSGTSTVVTVPFSNGASVFIRVAAVNAVGEGGCPESVFTNFSASPPGAATIQSAAWNGSQTVVNYLDVTADQYLFYFNATLVSPDDIVAAQSRFSGNYSGQDVYMVASNALGNGPASNTVTVADNS